MTIWNTTVIFRITKNKDFNVNDNHLRATYLVSHGRVDADVGLDPRQLQLRLPEQPRVQRDDNDAQDEERSDHEHVDVARWQDELETANTATLPSVPAAERKHAEYNGERPGRSNQAAGDGGLDQDVVVQRV